MERGGGQAYYLGDGVYEAVVKAESTKKANISSENKTSTFNSTTETVSNVQYDTYISSSHQATMYGEEETVWIGKAEIGLFYQKMPELPANATIQDAYFNFFFYYYVEENYLTVGAYPVEVAWDEFIVTWDTMETYENMGIGTQQTGSANLWAQPGRNANNPGRASVEVTEIVESWYSGERYNEGIALKRTGGTNNSVIIKAYESEEELCYWFYTITYILESTDNFIPSDMYYLQNMQSNTYAQLDDSVSPSTEGLNLKIYPYDDDNDQKWKIKYLHNGYYKITSSSSGKALTAPFEKNK